MKKYRQSEEKFVDSTELNEANLTPILSYLLVQGVFKKMPSFQNRTKLKLIFKDAKIYVLGDSPFD